MRKIYVVAGLGFGDEGKGSIVDALVHKYRAPLVVRYNGGAQAAHHVVAEDGRSHCISQFGSGTLHGAITFLSRFVTVDPPAIGFEAEHLIKEFGFDDPVRKLMVIDPRAPVVTPYHRAMNQLREIARGNLRHGSCGRGIGEVSRDISKNHQVLTIGDLMTKQGAGRKVLGEIQRRLIAEAKELRFDGIVHPSWGLMNTPPAEFFVDCVTALANVTISPTPWGIDERPIVFEGAQGVLLDEWHGFHPFTTWSTTTFQNALTVLFESFDGVGIVETVGVTRSFMTRHGAGPFPTYDRTLGHLIEDDHNKTNPWQEQFRVGYLDMPLLRFARDVVGPLSMLAVTHLDKLGLVREWRVCGHYGNLDLYLVPNTDKNLMQREMRITRNLQVAQPNYSAVFGGVPELLDILSAIAPVGIASFGPKASDKAFQAVV